MDRGGKNGTSSSDPLVRGGLLYGVLFETYRYPPGPAGEVPSHSHDEYHLCLSGTEPGSYRYRGARHVIPPGALSIIMPDTVHSTHELADRERNSDYTMLYPASAQMRELAGELGRSGSPFFADPIVRDRELAARMARLPELVAAPRLAQDEAVLSLLADLVVRHGAVVREERTPRRSRAVEVVRSYLHDKDAADVSLAELGSLAGLSPYHLARQFRAQVGMPPHAYQLQVRIGRAKRLLLRGLPVSRVAQETGFFDLSHFTRHFKRLVGATPGAYVSAAAEERKNVHYVVLDHS